MYVPPLCSVYVVTMSSQVVGGSMESLCAHIHNPSALLSLRVILQLGQAQPATLLEKPGIRHNFYRCISFRVCYIICIFGLSLSYFIHSYLRALHFVIKVVLYRPREKAIHVPFLRTPHFAGVSTFHDFHQLICQTKLPKSRFEMFSRYLMWSLTQWPPSVSM